jgi:hypothetical protein
MSGRLSHVFHLPWSLRGSVRRRLFPNASLSLTGSNRAGIPLKLTYDIKLSGFVAEFLGRG